MTMGVRRAAIAVAGVLLAAGCTKADPQQPATPAAAPPVSASAGPVGSTVAAPVFGSKPLWSRTISRDIGPEGGPDRLRDAYGVKLVGDALLIDGTRAADKKFQVEVVDARSGERRWSAVQGDPVRGGGGGLRHDFPSLSTVIGDPEGDWTLVVRSQRKLGGDVVEDGVMGLSGRDGSLRWNIPVQRESRCSCPWTEMDLMSIGAVDTTTLTVRIDHDQVRKGTVKTRTIAYGIPDGRRLWTVDGVDSQLALGPKLLLATRPKLPYQDTVGSPVTTVGAYDRRSGRKAWDLAGRYAKTSVSFAGDSFVILSTGQSSVFVDPVTGRELGSVPEVFSACDGSVMLVACRGDDRTLAVSRNGDLVTAAEIPGAERCYPIQVEGALLYCDDSSAGRVDSRSLDSTGAVAAAVLPGRLRTIGTGFAVFSTYERGQDSTMGGTFSVYEMQR